MKLLVAWTLGAFVVCGLGAGPARAQMDSREGIALQNQILELRRDLQQMRADQGRAPLPSSGSALAGGGRNATVAGGSSDLTAQLLERVDRLEDAIRQLNGRMDEADNARQRQGADLAKQISDLQFRLDNGGAPAAASGGGLGAAAAAGAAAGAVSGRPAAPPLGGSQAPTPLGTLPVAPGAPAAPVRRTPELALQEGNAALARRDYVTAEAAAREVINTSKQSPRGYDAQFLLAQAMMGQKNYPQAAVGYGDAYDRNKQGAHAQDSLIGLAASLTAINEKRSACAALDTLRTQFPTPRPDVGTRATALRASAGCR